MATRKPSRPPRPLAPGDIVAGFSEALGEWTAAQITHLDTRERKAAVLELDWSGPEPFSVDDLGDVSPLRITHHEWRGELSQSFYQWVLPRSFKVIGALPLLSVERPRTYSLSPEWRLGDQLAHQRRWDHGIREPWSLPHAVRWTGAELNRALADPKRARRDIRRLSVTDVESLHLARLVEHYPDLVQLSLWGRPGLLSQASGLNGLTSMKHVLIMNLFGMTKSDCLLPDRLPTLETLLLHSIPEDYAAAMRSKWRPEQVNGTYVSVTAARKPDWVAENLTNPLRDWDGRGHIGKTRYNRAVSTYKATRRAVLSVLSTVPPEDRAVELTKIGRAYGEAFNELDARRPFIETVEREDLFAALDAIVSEAQATLGLDLSWARERLSSGVDSVRSW